MGADSPAADNPFSNKDMAPVPPERRTWTALDMAVLWIALSACVTTYVLASDLIAGGMSAAQAVGVVFLGNLIVLVPILLNAHAGTKYGIPFPVYCRASFGLRGANVPAMVRAFIACGWFGIQTWVGGAAIYVIAADFVPAWAELPKDYFGLNAAQLGCFLFFWLINVAIIWRGIESIRWLLRIKAPLLIVLGLILLAWAYFAADGFGRMLTQPSKFGPGREAEFWTFFAGALTANVGYWATLSLNIPDFSRYARSQKDQILGQAMGLPTTMGLFAFIGVAVTSATVVIYGEEIWDPVKLLKKFNNPAVQIAAMFALMLATLATNIAANVVSPANDFSNLWPRRISFRIGGLITAVIGIVIQPWKLYEDPNGYIFIWLGGISSLLGAVGGILIADYYAIRRTVLDLDGLYRRGGPYWYVVGFNPVGLAALVIGITPCLPGFLHKVKFLEVDPVWQKIYSYAWFVSFGISFVVYVIGMALSHVSAKRR